MYSKDELSSKNITELEEIAQKEGIELKGGESAEDVIYSILDKQAEVEGNKNPLGVKRRRVRIVKKDTDRVYTVNGKEGENFDLKKNNVQNEELPNNSRLPTIGKSPRAWQCLTMKWWPATFLRPICFTKQPTQQKQSRWPTWH